MHAKVLTFHRGVIIVVCNNIQGQPAALVLARPFFLKVKMKFHFYKKQVINIRASVIFGLVKLIILGYNR